MTRTQALIGIPALAALLVLSGCATTKQLDEVRAMAQQAQMSADEAKSMAMDAKASSDRAASEASAARQAAEMAAQTSAETNQKLDEMFRRAMMK
jgi:murein lipoprotein